MIILVRGLKESPCHRVSFVYSSEAMNLTGNGGNDPFLSQKHVRICLVGSGSSSTRASILLWSGGFWPVPTPEICRTSDGNLNLRVLDEGLKFLWNVLEFSWRSFLQKDSKNKSSYVWKWLSKLVETSVNNSNCHIQCIWGDKDFYKLIYSLQIYERCHSWCNIFFCFQINWCTCIC